MKIKSTLLSVILCFYQIVMGQSQTCTLSGGPLDCNKDLCPSDSQIIIAQSDTIYNCDKPLNLYAPTLQISGNFFHN